MRCRRRKSSFFWPCQSRAADVWLAGAVWPCLPVGIDGGRMLISIITSIDLQARSARRSSRQQRAAGVRRSETPDGEEFAEGGGARRGQRACRQRGATSGSGAEQGRSQRLAPSHEKTGLVAVVVDADAKQRQAGARLAREQSHRVGPASRGEANEATRRERVQSQVWRFAIPRFASPTAGWRAASGERRQAGGPTACAKWAQQAALEWVGSAIQSPSI